MLETKEYVFVEVPRFQSLGLKANEAYQNCLIALRQQIKKVDLVIWVCSFMYSSAKKKPFHCDLSMERFLEDCFGNQAAQVGKLVVSNFTSSSQPLHEMKGWEKTFGIRIINSIEVKEVYDTLIHDQDVGYLRKEMVSYFKSVPTL